MTYKLTLDEMERRHGSIWRFDTARYTVACWAEAEDMDPADSFTFSDDIEFARSGNPAHWFCAFVGVFKLPDNPPVAATEDEDAELIGYDCLGGCSYNSFREFVSGHREGGPDNRNCLATKARGVVVCHYFPDMVREAISAAKAREISLQFAA